MKLKAHFTHNADFREKFLCIVVDFLRGEPIFIARDILKQRFFTALKIESRLMQQGMPVVKYNHFGVIYHIIA